MTRARLAIVLATATATALALLPGVAEAQGKAKLAREAAEYVLGKFGKQAVGEGVETFARKVETLALKYGDEAVDAIRKGGPRALPVIEEAGEQGAQAVRVLAKFGDNGLWVASKSTRLGLVSKYGDDAAEAMLKHREIAEPLIEQMGKPAAGAFKAISEQNGRRLVMLAEGQDLANMGRATELLEVIRQFGDNAMDFIWKHKGALTVTAALTAFLADPKPFLDGAQDITAIVAKEVARPLAEVPCKVAHEAARRIDWTRVTLFGLAIFGVLVAWRIWMRSRVATNPPMGPPPRKQP